MTCLYNSYCFCGETCIHVEDCISKGTTSNIRHQHLSHSLAPWTCCEFAYELASYLQGEVSLIHTNTNGLALSSSSPSVHVEHVISSKVWYFLHMSNDTWPLKTTSSPHICVDIFHSFITHLMTFHTNIERPKTKQNKMVVFKVGLDKLYNNTPPTISHVFFLSSWNVAKGATTIAWA